MSGGTDAKAEKRDKLMLADQPDIGQQYGDDECEDENPVKNNGRAQPHIFESATKTFAAGDNIRAVRQTIEQADQHEKAEDDHDPGRQK